MWWGVRSIIQRSPKVTLDERYLAIELSVQAAAAKAYIAELRRVGIVTEEGKPTPLALRWRMDETYAEAVKDLISGAYPEGLVQIAPPENADRQKVITWFQHEGLGQGSAGNKAATYLLLSSPTPNDAPRSPAKTPDGKKVTRSRASAGAASEKSQAKEKPENPGPSVISGGNRRAAAAGVGEAFPLNVNVQIHISADAGTEQIESIFQAMRRYLYDSPDS